METKAKKFIKVKKQKPVEDNSKTQIFKIDTMKPAVIDFNWLNSRKRTCERRDSFNSDDKKNSYNSDTQNI